MGITHNIRRKARPSKVKISGPSTHIMNAPYVKKEKDIGSKIIDRKKVTRSEIERFKISDDSVKWIEEHYNLPVKTTWVDLFIRRQNIYDGDLDYAEVHGLWRPSHQYRKPLTKSGYDDLFYSVRDVGRYNGYRVPYDPINGYYAPLSVNTKCIVVDEKIPKPLDYYEPRWDSELYYAPLKPYDPKMRDG
jgi:hypothetical protein